MYYIIEKIEQLEYLVNASEETCYVSVIPLNNNYHPALTSVSLIYFKPENDKAYMLCINHSEASKLSIVDVKKMLSKYKKCYCLDAKFHMYFLSTPSTSNHFVNLFDLNFMQITNGEEIMENNSLPIHDYFYRKHGNLENINALIPISKHFEREEITYSKLKMPINHIHYNYQNGYIFKMMESNGIKIDPKEFYKHYELQNENFNIKDGKIYTWYNLYGITGRPTNSFNGINFAAIPHKNRAAFIPENDLLVEMDYDCYHPRLIADLIGYPMNKEESGHKQLAKLYFETDQPTEEQISEGKKYTFKQMYGGIDPKWMNIPYFSNADEFMDNMHRSYVEQGEINLRGGRLVKKKGMNKSKLLSYYIQSMESALNLTKIYQLNKILSKTKSKLIYYNYDSFLFDVADDENYILDDIYNELSSQFPVKISYGKNYRDMQKYVIKP